MPGLFFSCASHGTSHPVQLIPTCCASAVTAALDLFQAAFFKVCLAKPIPQQAELGVQTPADGRPAASGTRWSQNGHLRSSMPKKRHVKNDRSQAEQTEFVAAIAVKKSTLRTLRNLWRLRPQADGDERQLSGGESDCRFRLTARGNLIVPSHSAESQYRRIATASSQRRCRISRADSARARPADCPAHACMRLTSPAFVAATLIAAVRPRWIG